MLKPLTRKEEIVVWSDRAIQAGAVWKDEIKKALAAARIAVLLVSPGFLASDFIAEHELPPLLEAANTRGLTTIWVYVSACLVEETPIYQYQAAHDVARPLETITLAEQNQVIAGICRTILRIERA